jgi:transposase InsO family protein
MRFEFIRAEKVNYPVRLMCRLLDVSRSGFYAWLEGRDSRGLNDRRLLGSIREIFAASGETYGSPRISHELRERGVACDKARVERLMRENGITPPRKKKYRVTTDSNHPNPVAPNILHRDFTSPGPNCRWAGDITYVWTWAGWLYLAVVLDLFSRRVVGWAMDSRLDTESLPLRALQMALANRAPERGLIHHSDRGTQYTSKEYQELLKARGIVCSMSRRGDCWDNAVVESFFATLKLDLIFRETFRTRQEARLAIFNYIEVFYNRQRRHSTLGYLSPAQFEELALRAEAVA